MRRAEAAFWAAMALAAIALLAYALFGCAEAAAQPAPAPTMPAMGIVERSDELAQQHRSHEVEQVEAGKLDIDGNPIDGEKAVAAMLREYVQAKRDELAAAQEPHETEGDPVCYEEGNVQEARSGGYGGSGKWWPDWQDASTTERLLNGQGRAYDPNGTSYTWYPNDIGNGSIEGRIPGCHYDENGVAYDGDGFIAVAGERYDPSQPPVEIETPYGPARIYDGGAGAGNIDIYTNR